MFFKSWTSVLHTVLTGVIAYGVLIVMLRTSGKRTLAKMNAFDLVVTVALGSTLSTALVSRTVPLADGVAALAVLILLQYLVAWVSVRSRRFEDLVKSAPTLLLYRGAIRHDQLRRQRVSEGELRAAARQAGLPSLGEVGAIVFETDGSFSVVAMNALPPHDAPQPLVTPE